MKARTFNSLMHYYNEEWAARVLGMKVNSGIGPDLLDDDKIAEVKFKLIYPGEYMHISWRALEHQMDYPVEFNKKGYWALGTYEFNVSVSDLKVRDVESLEKFVGKRELWVVNWDWMRQFCAYRQKGKTKFSEWDNTIRFAKKNKLPEMGLSRDVEGGLVNFAKDVNPKDFGFS